MWNCLNGNPAPTVPPAERQSSQATVKSTERRSRRRSDVCKTLLFLKQTKRSQLNWAVSVLGFCILQSLCECNTGTFKPAFYNDATLTISKRDKCWQGVTVLLFTPIWNYAPNNFVLFVRPFFFSFSQAEQALSQSNNINLPVALNSYLLYKDKNKEGSKILYIWCILKAAFIIAIEPAGFIVALLDFWKGFSNCTPRAFLNLLEIIECEGEILVWERG